MISKHTLYADPDLTIIYLQTVTANRKNHKYLNIKVCLSQVKRASLIVINSFRMVGWAFFSNLHNYTRCFYSVFERSDQPRQSRLANHNAPLNPIKWTNQSLPRRRRVPSAGKVENPIQDWFWLCIWLAEKTTCLLDSLVRRTASCIPRLVKFACTEHLSCIT